MQPEATKMLSILCVGDQQAADDVLALLYDELRSLAAKEMSRERHGHTLQPTALVHEAFLRMRNLKRIDWRGREHFCAVAAGVMRRVLIEHARKRSAVKRGEDATRISLEDAPTPWAPTPQYDLMLIDDALNRLAELQPRHAQVVEMRVFAGLSIAETATALGVSPTTVKDDWRMSRAWLKTQLEPPSRG